MLAAAASSFTAARAAEIVTPFDLSLLDEGFTPAELFFVREHFPAPSVSPLDWKLAVTGLLASPLEIPHAEFVKLPRQALAATLECAENPAGGGLVSQAGWEGVPLGAVLERAQPKPVAKFARLTGADGFSRTIPLAKAGTLLAFRMNGESLPPDHGAPVRAIVPGWYGMDSVKWLRGIDLLSDAPGDQAYRRRTRSMLAGVVAGDPVTAMLVKSVFARPVDSAILSSRRFTVRGVAWAGESAVRAVEVSVDGGKRWNAARLGAAAAPAAWSPWTWEWRIAAAGTYELVVRATDAAGNAQPAERLSNRADEYEQNHWQRVTVTVR